MKRFLSQVAACPVGDLFDALQATCVPTEICGAVTSVTESSPPMPPLERRDPAIEQPMKPEIATEQSEKPEQQPLPETSAPFGRCSTRAGVPDHASQDASLRAERLRGPRDEASLGTSPGSSRLPFCGS